MNALAWFRFAFSLSFIRCAIPQFKTLTAKETRSFYPPMRKQRKKEPNLTWLLPSTMLTPPPAAVTTTSDDEFESSFSIAATPSSGFAPASAGVRGTQRDGSIFMTEMEEPRALSLDSERERDKRKESEK